MLSTAYFCFAVNVSKAHVELKPQEIISETKLPEEFKNIEERIKPEEMDSLKKDIRKEFPKMKFKSEDKVGVNLEDVLGIRDFETEIYPNLK
jgi:hypothetical protein